MAHYVEKNLRPSENLVAKAKVSYVGLVPSVIGFVLFLVLGIIFIAVIPGGTGLGIGLPIIFWGIIWLIVQGVRLSNVELGVTDKKIIGKTGVIAVKSIDSYLEKIDNFSISETFGGKIFGYATIMICTTSMVMRFPFIKDAMAFKNIVMDCIDTREQQKMIDQAKFIKGDFSSLENSSASHTPARAAAESKTVICRNCGAENKAESGFCFSCGSKLG